MVSEVQFNVMFFISDSLIVFSFHIVCVCVGVWFFCLFYTFFYC